MTSAAADLLDQTPLTPDEYGVLEAGFARLVGGGRDIVLVQAEAILALEAIAASIAAPGRRALNVVTGPYGRLFGQWLRRGGAEVVDLETPFDDVVAADAVAAALAEHRPDILAIVHAEAATGGTNPIAEIAALAREAGVVTVLDSVSAIGAEPVPAARWGIDLVAIGGQKSLAGPPSPSAVAVSARAWEFIEENPVAPRSSSLSLLDWRDGWLRSDRTAIRAFPHGSTPARSSRRSSGSRRRGSMPCTCATGGPRRPRSPASRRSVSRPGSAAPRLGRRS